MASPDEDSAPHNQEKEFKRGVTVMKEVIRAKNMGIKLEVGWNKRGQPIDPNSSKFASYIGVVTRQIMPITCDHWRDSALDVFKDNIWAEIQAAFVVDESRRKYVLQVAGKLHRSFRAYLTKHCVRDANGLVNEHPPAKYDHIISEDVWKTFVDKRIGDSFQKLSVENRVRASSPANTAYPYRKSRMGYARLEQKLLQEIRLKKATCMNNADVIDNENVQQMQDHCETLSQSISEGEIQDCDRQDIHNKALNVPKSPDCVGGVGFVDPQIDYPPQKRTKTGNANKMQCLKEIEPVTCQVKSFENRFQEKEVERQPDAVCSNYEDRSTPTTNSFSEESIMAPTRNLGKPLLQVSPAVTANSLPPYCNYLDIHVRCKMRDGHQLRINIAKDIFGFQYDEMIGGEQINELLHHKPLGASVVCVYIRYLYEHLMLPYQKAGRFSFLSPQRTSGFATEQTQYIADVLLANAEKDKLFLAPYNTGEHWVLIVINPIAEIVYFLDPMNGDLRNCPTMKIMFNRGLQIYRANSTAEVPISKSSNIKWTTIECCGQTTIDGDYCVLRFMKEIILPNRSMMDFPDHKSFSYYSRDKITEVKEEWCRYVVENFC